MKKTFLCCVLIALCTSIIAQNNMITAEMLSKIKAQGKLTPTECALQRAMSNVDIKTLAVNSSVINSKPTPEFSDKVETKGITNQKSSGRCWLFTGLNVIRARAMSEKKLPTTYFSPLYLFFYDQLEKSNLFLQGVIETRRLPIDDRQVEWFFSHPVSDGGTYTGVADLTEKYGIVPQLVMPENNVSNNTSQMSNLLNLKLREFGLELRDMPAKASYDQLMKRKTEMLAEVYHILALTLGEPVESFEWDVYDADGKVVGRKTYTPLEYYKEIIGGDDLIENYVMLMNDPSREYYKVYEIQYDRHLYEGHNWLYLNLPIEEIKEAAVKSIKGNRAMYIGCDVGKCYNAKTGWLDLNNYNYDDIMGTTFNMNKKQRVLSKASASSHAMTLIAVDIDSVSGKTIKWMVENSWGADRGYNGNLIMTDEWFDEYMFRVVVHRDYLNAKTIELLKQRPIGLPAWDPMFAVEE